ncbi:MAG TPA: glycosyltransferase [Candidatus Binatia bacterium]|nr:glycosyltransferase [Candidatus Binatia bacterium]
MSRGPDAGKVEQRPGVSILIPAYGAAEALEVCLGSLARYAPPDYAITILDDGTPDDSIEKVYRAAQRRIVRLGYYRSDANRGFVSICNWGYKNIREPGCDLLLLNSDTEVTAGSLEEMQAVLYLHDRHAVVTPRSNNGTIFSVPWVGGLLPENESYEVWSKLRHLLPRYQVMPTAVGFCMMIKNEALERFGLFDEIYSPGYNEENDFVCRINRFGYSAVSANWAYVYHRERGSFGQRRAALEAANSKKLTDRYPEYHRKVDDYSRYFMDPVEVFARLYAPHKPRFLFDLRDLQPSRYGTSEVAFNLLREIGQCLGQDIELYVGVGDARSFFAAELAGFKLYDSRSDDLMLFDLAFRPFQIFAWTEFRNLNMVAPRLCYLLHDIIMVRCEYLNSPERQILFRKAAELSDRVITISEYSKQDFERFYGMSMPMSIEHHGTMFATNKVDGRTAGSYILIMGNNYAHKGVREAVEQLQDSPWPIVVIGGEPDRTVHHSISWYKSGAIPPQEISDLFRSARMLVYPSHYEGFGLPVIDALALGIPVIALDTAINRELADLTADPNLHRISSIHDLTALVSRLFDQQVTSPARPARTWSQVAEEYVAIFREMLSQPVDVDRLRRRWELIRTVQSVGRW